MITYTSGDIFDSHAQTLVNPVNTVGIMGKGLAKHFKIRFPEMFADYKTACDSGDLAIGQLHLFRTDDKWILNFPTKSHWRSSSKATYIETGLKQFVAIYKDEEITSVAFPMLGCGLGGLDWTAQVQPLMEQYLQGLDIPIEVYADI